MADWTKTDEAGIYRHPEINGKYKIRATATDPDTRKLGERRKRIEDATMTEAIKVRGELKAEIRRPTTAQPDRKLFVDWIADWIDNRIAEGRWAKSTAAKNKRIIRQHVAPSLADLYVDEIDRSAIRGWIEAAENKRRKRNGEMVPYAHSTLRTWWGLLKNLVKGLYLADHCDRRFYEWVCDRTGPKSNVSGRRERRTLTLKQLHEFVATARELVPKRYPEIATLAYTGMRAGELYGLEIQHVDFDEGVIHVEQAICSETMEPKSTKTGESRTVVIDFPRSPVPEAIQAQRQRLVKAQNPGFVKQGILFPTRTGKRRKSQSLHKPMRAVARACGVDWSVTPQTFRRTLNTLIGALGFPTKVAKSIMGHESDAMNAHYTEHNPEQQREALAALF